MPRSSHLRRNRSSVVSLHRETVCEILLCLAICSLICNVCYCVCVDPLDKSELSLFYTLLQQIVTLDRHSVGSFAARHFRQKPA